MYLQIARSVKQKLNIVVMLRSLVHHCFSLIAFTLFMLQRQSSLMLLTRMLARPTMWTEKLNDSNYENLFTGFMLCSSANRLLREQTHCNVFFIFDVKVDMHQGSALSPCSDGCVTLRQKIQLQVKGWERETSIRWHNIGTTAKRVTLVRACIAKGRQMIRWRNI